MTYEQARREAEAALVWKSGEPIGDNYVTTLTAGALRALLAGPPEAMEDEPIGDMTCLDQFDAAAERWFEIAGVQRMIQAVTSVFAKWAPPGVMEAYQTKVGDMVRQAFVEGAVRVYDARLVKLANDEKADA